MALDVTSNADQVAPGMVGELVDQAQAAADAEAADTALALVGPKTPRRTGELAAGLRSAVVPTGGFELTAAAPYGGYVDARTGFATDTLIQADTVLTDIYAAHLQARFDQL